MVGCAEAKPYLRTADDVASSLCAIFFSEQQGLSVEEAAAKFCQTKDQLQPWIDEVLAAKRQAGIQALGKQK